MIYFYRCNHYTLSQIRDDTRIRDINGNVNPGQQDICSLPEASDPGRSELADISLIPFGKREIRSGMRDHMNQVLNILENYRF